MKLLITLAFCATVLLAGCQTPGKYIATSSTTVDHAMQAWAVYVVDGHATPEQELAVRKVKTLHEIAEDAAVLAYTDFKITGDKTVWLKARDVLRLNQANLLAIIASFTNPTPTNSPPTIVTNSPSTPPSL